MTLAEILVVVGVMVLILAIVLPSVIGVRRRARYTESSHMLTALQNAIDNYHAAFADYPGPLPEGYAASSSGFSGPQNLAIGLMGFLNSAKPALPDAAYPWPPDWIALPGNVNVAMRPGVGPVDWSQTNVSPQGKSYHPFYAPKPGELAYASGTAAAAGTPVGIPVLFDKFADPLPILYFRANRTMYRDTAGKWRPAEKRPVLAEKASLNPATTPDAAFLRLTNQAYICSSSSDSGGLASTSGAQFPQDSSLYFQAANADVPASNGVTFASYLEQTLTNLNTTNVTGAGATAVVGKAPRGGYVLISAGVDRVYGPHLVDTKVIESDDIVVAGP